MSAGRSADVKFEIGHVLFIAAIALSIELSGLVDRPSIK
jgi:hypothetical protein